MENSLISVFAWSYALVSSSGGARVDLDAAEAKGNKSQVNALTRFFLTRLSVFLLQERHTPILKAGFSLSAARKTPIVFGLGLSMGMDAGTC